MPVALASPFTWSRGILRIFTLVIVGIFFGVACYQMFSARCPRCKARVLLALGTLGVRVAIPRWYMSCPSCGLSFDTQCDATQKV
jgi:hypothetical protein